jgi:hypothetical protein
MMQETVVLLIGIPLSVLFIAALLYILGPIFSLPVFIVEALIHRGGRGYDDPLHPA